MIDIEEKKVEAALRPTKLSEFSGQPRALAQLSVALEAAKQRGEALDHVLLCGPPGLGKTTLAQILAGELGVSMEQTAAPVLQRKSDLTSLLSMVTDRSVLFVDEIHRMKMDIEEILYSALEDFRLDLVLGSGAFARTSSLQLPRFTAVGATTRLGALSAPLRGRFGIILHLEPYDEQTLGKIVARSARLLNVEISPEAACEVGRRGRGTPRIANRLLRRVRDYAQVWGKSGIDLGVARKALDELRVDRYGLDDVDRKILVTIAQQFGGGPVGLKSIAAAVDEHTATIEDAYEPYLIQLGFLERTAHGRKVTPRAFDHFSIRRRTVAVPTF